MFMLMFHFGVWGYSFLNKYIIFANENIY